MNYCTRCGYKAEENARFCTKCGAELNVKEADITDTSIETKYSTYKENVPDKKNSKNKDKRNYLNRIVAIIAIIIALFFTINVMGSFGTGIISGADTRKVYSAAKQALEKKNEIQKKVDVIDKKYLDAGGYTSEEKVQEFLSEVYGLTYEMCENGEITGCMYAPGGEALDGVTGVYIEIDGWLGVVLSPTLDGYMAGDDGVSMYACIPLDNNESDNVKMYRQNAENIFDIVSDNMGEPFRKDKVYDGLDKVDKIPFKDLFRPHSFIVWSGHGGYVEYTPEGEAIGNFLELGELKNLNDFKAIKDRVKGLKNNGNTTPAQERLGIKNTDNEAAFLLSMFDKNALIAVGDKYALTSEFFTSFAETDMLEGSVFCTTACSALAGERELSKAMTNKGLAIMIGPNGIINSEYCINTITDLIERYTAPKEDGSYPGILESLEEVRKIHGHFDSVGKFNANISFDLNDTYRYGLNILNILDTRIEGKVTSKSTGEELYADITCKIDGEVFGEASARDKGKFYINGRYGKKAELTFNAKGYEPKTIIVDVNEWTENADVELEKKKLDYVAIYKDFLSKLNVEGKEMSVYTYFPAEKLIENTSYDAAAVIGALIFDCDNDSIPELVVKMSTEDNTDTIYMIYKHDTDKGEVKRYMGIEGEIYWSGGSSENQFIQKNDNSFAVLGFYNLVLSGRAAGTPGAHHMGNKYMMEAEPLAEGGFGHLTIKAEFEYSYILLDDKITDEMIGNKKGSIKEKEDELFGKYTVLSFHDIENIDKYYKD